MPPPSSSQTSRSHGKRGRQSQAADDGSSRLRRLGSGASGAVQLSQKLPEHLTFSQTEGGYTQASQGDDEENAHDDLLSQPVVARPNERINIDKMGKSDREKLVKDMARYMLFKGFRGEPIVKSKAAADVLSNYKDIKISGAIFEDAATTLFGSYGFQVLGPPKWMIGSLPARYKERLYVTNPISDEGGIHSRSLHDNSTAGDRGILMTCLALAYCKGVTEQRWIGANQLYRYLNDVDPVVPEEPPREIKGGVRGMSSPERRAAPAAGSVPNGLSGPVNELLDGFVARDYLLREKRDVEGDLSGTAYSIGPRSVLEVGREQLVTFCAEIMDEEPDRQMIAEITGVDESQGEEFSQESR